ncbi:MAG: hypothetical protein ACOH18_00850 [Candidatus Saccharimonadaceae bacterium]
MDIVYLVKHSPENDSEELRYSLRSLKNIPHNNVVIVGEKPDWITNVTFIPVAQVKTKKENVRESMHTAAKSELITDEFILMNDDFFFMKPISSMPNLNFGPMKEVIEHYQVRYPEGSGYMDIMISQYELLLKLGVVNPISYELHVPMVINKQDMNGLSNYFTDNIAYQFRSLYGNLCTVGGETIPDVKVFINQQHNNPEYVKNPRSYLENQNFLSATGGSFKHELVGDFVKQKFPEKSEYEL